MGRAQRDRRIGTGGGEGLGSNPFDKLESGSLPAGRPEASPPGEAARRQKPEGKKRGRVDVRREKAGRGGKEVTVLTGEGFEQVHPAFLDDLLRELKTRAGCGGTRKGKTIELQGDRREQAEAALRDKGFRVVRAGG